MATRTAKNGGYSTQQLAYLNTLAAYEKALKQAESEYPPELIDKDQLAKMSDDDSLALMMFGYETREKYHVNDLKENFEDARWALCEWGNDYYLRYAKKHKDRAGIKMLEDAQESIKNKRFMVHVRERLTISYLKIDPRR